MPRDGFNLEYLRILNSQLSILSGFYPVFTPFLSFHSANMSMLLFLNNGILVMITTSYSKSIQYIQMKVISVKFSRSLKKRKSLTFLRVHSLMVLWFLKSPNWSHFRLLMNELILSPFQASCELVRLILSKKRIFIRI